MIRPFNLACHKRTAFNLRIFSPLPQVSMSFKCLYLLIQPRFARIFVPFPVVRSILTPRSSVSALDACPSSSRFRSLFHAWIRILRRFLDSSHFAESVEPEALAFAELARFPLPLYVRKTWLFTVLSHVWIVRKRRYVGNSFPLEAVVLVALELSALSVASEWFQGTASAFRTLHAPIVR